MVNATGKAYHHLCTRLVLSFSHTPSFTRFCKGKEKVLVMTNCCARGMHIDIPLVVNYDIPVDAHNRADCESYLRR